MKPYFEIRRAKNNAYYFVLIAANSEIIANSEMYTTKQSAKNGIESIRKNAPIADLRDTTIESKE